MKQIPFHLFLKIHYEKLLPDTLFFFYKCNVHCKFKKLLLLNNNGAGKICRKKSSFIYFDENIFLKSSFMFYFKFNHFKVKLDKTRFLIFASI